MEVSRTCHVLAPVLSDPPSPPVYCGYLQRLSARSVTSGRKWCRRWFAVKLDGVLYWYRTTKVSPLLEGQYITVFIHANYYNDNDTANKLGLENIFK